MNIIITTTHIKLSDFFIFFYCSIPFDTVPLRQYFLRPITRKYIQHKHFYNHSTWRVGWSLGPRICHLASRYVKYEFCLDIGGGRRGVRKSYLVSRNFKAEFSLHNERGEGEPKMGGGGCEYQI